MVCCILTKRENLSALASIRHLLQISIFYMQFIYMKVSLCFI
jgi:hypothetical protein